MFDRHEQIKGTRHFLKNWSGWGLARNKSKLPSWLLEKIRLGTGPFSRANRNIWFATSRKVNCELHRNVNVFLFIEYFAVCLLHWWECQACRTTSRKMSPPRETETWPNEKIRQQNFPKMRRASSHRKDLGSDAEFFFSKQRIAFLGEGKEAFMSLFVHVLWDTRWRNLLLFFFRQVYFFARGVLKFREMPSYFLLLPLEEVLIRARENGIFSFSSWNCQRNLLEFAEFWDAFLQTFRVAIYPIIITPFIMALSTSLTQIVLIYIYQKVT